MLHSSRGRFGEVGMETSSLVSEPCHLLRSFKRLLAYPPISKSMLHGFSHPQMSMDNSIFNSGLIKKIFIINIMYIYNINI